MYVPAGGGWHFIHPSYGTIEVFIYIGYKPMSSVFTSDGYFELGGSQSCFL
jgi:hypothetical protein